MEKVCLVAFNGEMMCFVHVLLNALDMKEKGFEVKIVMEGSATRLVSDLVKGDVPFANLYSKARAQDLFDCFCQACSAKMGVLDVIDSEGLPLRGEMGGHPSLARYIDRGFRVITF